MSRSSPAQSLYNDLRQNDVTLSLDQPPGNLGKLKRKMSDGSWRLRQRQTSTKRARSRYISAHHYPCGPFHDFTEDPNKEDYPKTRRLAKWSPARGVSACHAAYKGLQEVMLHVDIFGRSPLPDYVRRVTRPWRQKQNKKKQGSLGTCRMDLAMLQLAPVGRRTPTEPLSVYPYQ